MAPRLRNCGGSPATPAGAAGPSPESSHRRLSRPGRSRSSSLAFSRLPSLFQVRVSDPRQPRQPGCAGQRNHTLNFYSTSFPCQAAVSWQGLCRILMRLGCRAPYYDTTDARNMELNKIANDKFNEHHMARAQAGIRQVSSCLSPGTDHCSDGWRRESSSPKARDTTSFLLPGVAWRRTSLQRMSPLACSGASAFL